MKQIRWNIGLLIIRLGYYIRDYETTLDERINSRRKFTDRMKIGMFLLRVGYKFRGEIPQRRWFKWIHI